MTLGTEKARKDEIILKFKSNPLYTDKELAEVFGVSRQYIGRILREYKEDKEKLVPILFFCQGKTITEIEYETNITAPTIRKILKKFGKRYELEKEMRRSKANERARECKKSYMERRRREANEENALIVGMMQQQKYNALEMSSTRPLTNRSIVEDNLSHYTYNKNKTYLVFKDNYILPHNFPKKISCKISLITTSCKKFENGVDGTTIER